MTISRVFAGSAAVSRSAAHAAVSRLPHRLRRRAMTSQTAWRLLDYLAVDYARRGSRREDRQHFRICRDARILRLGRGTDRRAARPSQPSRRCVAESAQLRAAIERKAPAERSRPSPARSARDLLAAYPVPLGPKQRARRCARRPALAQNCASCHGATGDAQTADGAAARSAAYRLRRPRPRRPAQPVRPLPSDRPGPRRHRDAELRAACPTPTEWALAFQVGRFAYPDALARQGKRIWDSDAGASPAQFPISMR